MKVRTATAGTGLSARLTAIGCGTLAILASVAVSACTASSPSAAPTRFSPGASVSATPTALSSGTARVSTPSASASPSASPSATPSRSDSPLPTAAPPTGGGGTAGFQDALLFGLGGAAMLAGWAWTSSNLVSAASLGNSRWRPPPATTGLIIRVSSSTSPSPISDRTSDGLPAVPIVPPSCWRSSATKSATGPLISVLLGHWATESRVREATYFGVPLIQLANGSSADVGQ